MDVQGLQRWWQDHRGLDSMIQRLEADMEAGPGPSLSLAVEEFVEGVEEHFELEENLYFPLVRRAAPRLEPGLATARRAHEGIRAELDKLLELVGSGETSSAKETLRVALEQFRAHEAQEAELIAELADLGALD